MPDIPVVLVTGASRGLGRGIAVEAAAEGFSVVINYASNAAAADETVALCQQAARTLDQRFLPVKGDVSNRVDRDAVLGQTLDALGRIDALVNNAGIAPRVRADLTETSEASFEELLRINLQGPFFLTQAVANHWLRAPYAPAIASGFKIVFVTSISADTASISRGEYCISKAGLAMASQLWAVRLAEHGVQVLELRPGIMATDMTSGVKGKYDALLAEGLVPQRRWGTAEDVGRAVRAVLAGHFPFTTGEVIHLDGGFHIRRL
ncbi:3-oxoacyl-[acyl-carrier-protein] reductase FabG [Luteitalea pratensis]|uniref:3-oxoacyl-[acyl-carrier-protein] reductase FabG n=1 Tax=Luteitalea pratensis TaxID=1855912 RepID=A0A143PHP7_LUTPR|nr:3-ketoacyl-ACP reductase [Luteitalea pratensis]AMY07279.1 3-oxoacyl-[acyl-carrier-protein] reductase FabG [Luteitalea pratensis]